MSRNRLYIPWNDETTYSTYMNVLCDGLTRPKKCKSQREQEGTREKSGMQGFWG